MKEPDVITHDDTSTALSQMTKAEVDMQVATAKQFPRDITAFRRNAVSMATLDQETAASCTYALKRGRTVIEGPSVRLAEICASAWGNIRCQARVVDEGPEFLTAQGTAWDMEKNVLVQMEVRRRITTRDGTRYNEDMRAVTGNAASSIAFRNAVFRVIPNSFIKSIMDQAKDVARGDERTLKDRRDRALAWLVDKGATEKQVLHYLGVEGVESIELKHLDILQGVRTAVMDGSTTIKREFSPEPDKPAKPATEPQSGKHKVERPKKVETQEQPKPEPPQPQPDIDVGPPAMTEEEQAKMKQAVEGWD
jgi:hypothetical protein